jgi:hypothetical protein
MVSLPLQVADKLALWTGLIPLTAFTSTTM